MTAFRVFAIIGGSLWEKEMEFGMRKRMLFLVAVLLCALGLSGAAGESALRMALCPYSFRIRLEMNTSMKTVGLYGTPGLTGRPAEQVNAESGLVLLGRVKDSWMVRHGDTVGYVERSRMKIAAEIGGTEPVSENVRASSLALPRSIIRRKEDGFIPLQGALELAEPVDYVAFILWDEWQRQTEQVWTLFPEAPVTRLEEGDWQRLMPTKDLTGGRKMLCIQGSVQGTAQVLARIPFFVDGKVMDPASLNSQCRFSPNERALQDHHPENYWRMPEKNPELTVTLPESGEAALLQLEWYAPPEKTEVTVSGPEGDTLLQETLETGFYLDSVFLPENARTVVIHPQGTNIRLSSVRVYDKDYPRDRVQVWQGMPEKLDMLLFSAHQDDEILFFSGLTPWYSHLGKSMGIVYMADCGRERYREAMEGIWFSGMRVHPVFLGYPDRGISGMEYAEKLWEGSQAEIVRQIRRSRPDVVVVQDRNGEYGHMQHRLTSLQVCRAVEYAADPSWDPASAAEYGAWEVKKLYVHLYEENRVHMDWHVPLGEYGGFTPWEVAVEAFEFHHTQQGFFKVERQGVEYDSACFGLYYSAVGPDTGKNDMFEHID